MIEDSGQKFRQAAGRFASGVTVVTTSVLEGAYGITVSSFASLSLNPLLVTVSINRSSPLLNYVRAVETFAVSVLASDQQEVARFFATSGRKPERGGFSTVSSTVSRPAPRSLLAASAGSTALWRTSFPVVIMKFSSGALRRLAAVPANHSSTGQVIIGR
jgi:flavin reductase (DIM6/NTAB) family NADH-FMN oxidoreductase RutF